MDRRFFEGLREVGKGEESVRSRQSLQPSQKRGPRRGGTYLDPKGPCGPVPTHNRKRHEPVVEWYSYAAIDRAS